MSSEPIRYDPNTGAPIYADKPSLTDIVFAWFCLLAGYAYCRVFPVIDHPMGGMLYLLGLFVVSTVVFLCMRKRLGWMAVAMALSALVLLPALVLSCNRMIHFIVFTYGHLVWLYYVYATVGRPLEKGFSDLIPWDFFKALFLMPFVSLGKIFGALFVGRKSESKAVLKILLGIAIAVFPTVIVGALLSYDASFVGLFKRLFAFRWGDLFSHLFSLILGIPIGMYFYGLFYSSHKGKNASFDAECCRKKMAAVRLLPRLSAMVAALPLLLVYGLFFASQWEVYLSAFSGILPSDFTPAQYARDGFFQLCAVAVINLVLIMAMQAFVRRRTEKAEWTTRILSIVFSCITLGLIATAFSKLYLYITRFGLTPKRVYAGWFMIILAAVFLLVLFKQFFQRFRMISVAAIVCVALFAVLALSGSDRMIAKYNVDRYLAGSLDDVDVWAMEELGDAAIPELIRLAEALDQKNGSDISDFCYEDAMGEGDLLYKNLGCALLGAADREPATFFSFTMPRIRAEQALKEAGITAEK